MRLLIPEYKRITPVMGFIDIGGRIKSLSVDFGPGQKVVRNGVQDSLFRLSGLA
jgi:hypothetical protein